MKGEMKTVLWITLSIAIIGGGIGAYLFLAPKDGDVRTNKDGSKSKYTKGSGWQAVISTDEYSTTSSTAKPTNTPKPATQNTTERLGYTIVAPSVMLPLFSGDENTAVYAEKSYGVPNLNDSRYFARDMMIGVVNALINFQGISYIRVNVQGNYYLVLNNKVYSKKY